MNKDTLSEKCSDIEESIWESYIDITGNCEPILDGIVDIDKFLAAKFKILWILKEPYDDFENGIATGGGWHYGKDFLNSPDFQIKIGRSRATWQPIVYSSYGILNNFQLWDEMPYIRDKKEMMDIVQSIAVINISKLPGLTRTKDFQVIVDAYQKNKNIILHQIETYQPDVIIGASTLQLLYTDLGISANEIQNSGSIEVISKKEKLLINAYHPAQTTVSRQQYVDDIINAVKNWNKIN